MSELDVYNAENSNPIVIKMKKLGKGPILCFLLVSAFVVSQQELVLRTCYVSY